MAESRSLNLLIVFLYSGFLVYFLIFNQDRRGWPDRRAVKLKRCACAKKSNQKKAHNLTKIDPDITYSLWGGFIQYILAVPTKTYFHSTLIARQYLSSPPANIILIPQTFQNTMRLQRTSSVDFFLF